MSDLRLSKNVSIDDDSDILTIYGVRYSGIIFRGLGFDIREDEYFQIIDRKDGTVSVRVTRKPPFDGQVGDDISGD